MNEQYLHGDCREVMRTFEAESVDAIVTDPPYGLTFMGKDWDNGVPGEAFWREALRVAKPGAHLLAFGGTRTFHRLVCAIEDAGWEIRDTVMWIYGSGFPKSLDVSKAIDKVRDWTKVQRLNGEINRARQAAGLSLKQIGEAMQAATAGQYGAWYHRGGHMFFETGRALPSRPEWECLRRVLPIAPEFQRAYEEAEREVIGEKSGLDGAGFGNVGHGLKSTSIDITAPATDAARQWQGWGTALKPAFEPIILARKPLIGTVAANVLAHGTGALNIAACRVGTEGGGGNGLGSHFGQLGNTTPLHKHGEDAVGTLGRWPANVILSYPEDEYALLDNVTTEQKRELFGWLSANA